MTEIKKEEVKVSVPSKVVYEGEFRILNSKASPIKWDGKTYSPKDAEEIAELEYHVKLGRITKK